MKLINGRDYYDSCQYGSDFSSCFVRDCSLVNVTEFFQYNTRQYDLPYIFQKYSEDLYRDRFYRGTATLLFFSVFFAGTFFPVVCTTYKSNRKKKRMGMEFTTYEYFYSLEDLLEHFVGDQHYDFLLKKRKKFEDYFNHTYSKTLLEFMIKNRIVNGHIFSGYHKYTNIKDICDNPDLSYDRDQWYCFANNFSFGNICFYKVYDSYRAFQELEMYVTGVLPESEAKMETISDTSKLLKAGFDRKISFRHPIKL
jgi:hypothetical protein